MANITYTKGVKRWRKYLKHLHGEGKHIVYDPSEYWEKKNKVMWTAYIVRYPFPKNHKPVRLVPGRMAEQVWRFRRDQ